MRGDEQRPGDFVKTNRGMIAVIAGALLVGTGAGFWLSRGPAPTGGKPDSAIEWKRVQAVPTRTPDANDQDWQNRVDALDHAGAAAQESDKSDAAPDPAPLESANQ